MALPYRAITFYEHRGFIGRDGKLTDRLADLGLLPDELASLSRLSESLVSGKSLFRITGETIQATSHVGVFTYSNLRFEILPKLLAPAKDGKSPHPLLMRNLMFMLSYTNRLEMQDMDLTSLESERGNFIEAYIEIFSRRLENHLKRHGVPKRYIEHESNLSHIKGRINWPRNLVANIIDQSKTYCNYSDFSEDNSTSQALKYVAVALSGLTSLPDNLKTLQRCIGLLDGVHAHYVTASELDRVQHGKRDRNFLGLIQLTRLFLERLRPEFGHGSKETFALLFDMNELFEEFVFQALHRNASSFAIAVRAQKKKRLVEAETDLLAPQNWEKRSLFDTYTDIEVKFADGTPPLIIDTKYKLVGTQSHYGISNADVYQVLAYRQIHKSKEVDPNVLLLYPQSEVPLRRLFKVSTSESTFAAATIDVSRDLRTSFGEFLSELRELIWSYTGG